MRSRAGQLWARILLPTRRARLLPTWNDVTALTMAAVSDTPLTLSQPHISYSNEMILPQNLSVIVPREKTL